MKEFGSNYGCVNISVIEAYLDLITRDRDDARFVPSDVIETFEYKNEIASEWLQQLNDKGGINSVRYWFSTHTNGYNRNNWILSVFDVEINDMVICDSNGQNIDGSNQFKNLMNFFNDLYALNDGHLNMNQVGWTNKGCIPDQIHPLNTWLFLLMYAEEIIKNGDISTSLHFNRDEMKECRAKIHRELMADRM